MNKIKRIGSGLLLLVAVPAFILAAVASLLGMFTALPTWGFIVGFRSMFLWLQSTEGR